MSLLQARDRKRALMMCGLRSIVLSHNDIPEHNALRERIQRVHKLQLGVSSQRDHLVHLLQLASDDTESRHELVQTLLPQILMEFALLVTEIGDLVELADSLQVLLLLQGIMGRVSKGSWKQQKLNTIDWDEKHQEALLEVIFTAFLSFDCNLKSCHILVDGFSDNAHFKLLTFTMNRKHYCGSNTLNQLIYS